MITIYAFEKGGKVHAGKWQEGVGGCGVIVPKKRGLVCDVFQERMDQ